LAAESFALANQALERSARNDFGSAAALALRALQRRHEQRQVVPEAVWALYGAVLNLHERVTYRGHQSGVRQVMFGPDERLAFTLDDKNLRVWDTNTGRLKQTIDCACSFSERSLSDNGRQLVVWDRWSNNEEAINIKRPIARYVFSVTSLASLIAYSPLYPSAALGS
jgi:WD40 repeat protein